MAIDSKLLEILVCPKSHGPLELVSLPEDVRKTVVDRYREHFRDEEPIAEQGLLCRESDLIYPIVSDIPMMIQDEALPASVLGGE